MLKIAFGLYRQWGYDIFKNILVYQKIRRDFLVSTLIVSPNRQFVIEKKVKKQIQINIVNPSNQEKIYNILLKNKIDIIFWYSWSWIIDKPLLNDFICICLHPSLLPEYRGGTPLQHQIIRGEKTSGVTIFKMTKNIDAGPIYQQEPMSLIGNVNDIFSRMIDIGTYMTKKLIQAASTSNGELTFTPQNNPEKYPPNKRRTPNQSEIKVKELNKINYEQLYNLIRCLLDPYPNAYIAIGNRRLLIQEVDRYTILHKNSLVISHKNPFDLQSIMNHKNIYLQINDGYAKLVKFKIK